ncbi:MAG: hypothetical protein AAF674_16595 [Pseudomonadota bacterium]
MEREDFARGFLARLDLAIKQSGKSRRQVSIEAKGPDKPRAVSNMFSQQTLPGAAFLSALCVVLDVSPSYLLGLDGTTTVRSLDDGNVLKEASTLLNRAVEIAEFRLMGRDTPPTIDALISWWRKNDKRLTNIGDIGRHLDIYRPPGATETSVFPLQLGTDSLAARTLRSKETPVLSEFLWRLPQDVLDRVTESHVKAADTGNFQLTTEDLHAPLPTGTIIQMQYDRLILPFEGEDGRKLTLCYARLFGPPQEVT